MDNRVMLLFLEFYEIFQNLQHYKIPDWGYLEQRIEIKY